MASPEDKDAALSPLDVMRDNMNHWNDVAHAIAAKLENLFVAEPKHRRVAIKLKQNLLAARVKALRYALAAAPYCHPKLKPAEQKSSEPPTEITMNLPPPAFGEDRSYRDGPLGCEWGSLTINLRD